MKNYTAAVIVLSILLISACSFSPAIRNKPLVDADAQAANYGYTFSNWLLDLQQRNVKLPPRVTVITLSGGGTRAAAFGDAAINRLKQIPAPCADQALDDQASWTCNLAQNTIIVSGISGGSMTAARFVLKGPEGLSAMNEDADKDGDFGQYVLRHPLFWDGIEAFLYPRYWLDRSEKLTYLFSHDYEVGDATYGDLMVQWRRGYAFRPFLILSSSDVLVDRSFTFDQDRMDDLCSDLNQFKLADAVAAASDLPYVFSDLELVNFRERGSCGLRSDRMEHQARRMENAIDNAYIDLPAATEASYRYFFRISGPENHAAAKNDPTEMRRVEYLHLVDGGLADNLGIRPVTKLLSEVPPKDEKTRSPLQKLGALGVREIVFIQINARSDAPPRRNQKAGSSSWLGLIQQTSFGPIDTVTELSSTLAYETVVQFALQCKAFRQLKPPECVGIPTKLFPIRFDFDLLPYVTEEQKHFREAVKNIQTTDQLTPIRLHQVREALARLADGDPCMAVLSSPARPDKGCPRLVDITDKGESERQMPN